MDGVTPCHVDRGVTPVTAVDETHAKSPCCLKVKGRQRYGDTMSGGMSVTDQKTDRNLVDDRTQSTTAAEVIRGEDACLYGFRWLED